MALVSLRQLLDDAAEHGYGIPAFNVNNMEQVLAILAAAHKVNAPVIIQASKGARAYANDAVLKHLMVAGTEMYPDLPICVHQDHGPTPEVCFSAMSNGFTSVMMDGSLMPDGTPATHEYNARVTREVSQAAHQIGVSVEGEIGVIGSLETGKGEKEDGHGFDGAIDKSKLLTDPDDSVRFVEETHVDALAVAIGTSHGAYKFTRKPDGAILSIDTIKKIHEKLPHTHLVMHGSSSVPQDLQDIINAYGGKMPQTYGVPVEEIQEAIKHGVRKVNVDTDLRMAMTGAIRKVFVTKPEEFDPRKYLKPAMDAMQAVCELRYQEFGAAGQAAHIRPISLADMAARYASGELAPKINR